MIDHATTLQQFSDQEPPDPQNFLKMLWPHLTPQQKELIQAYLTQPQPEGQPAQPGPVAPIQAPPDIQPMGATNARTS